MPWQVGLYAAAVLIPLAAFLVEILFIRRLGRLNAPIATAAIGLSCALSAVGFVDYFLIEDRAALAEPAGQLPQRAGNPVHLGGERLRDQGDAHAGGSRRGGRPGADDRTPDPYPVTSWR